MPLRLSEQEDFTMSLAQMDKLKTDDEPSSPENVASVGSVFYVNKAIDKASVRNGLLSSRPLKMHAH